LPGAETASSEEWHLDCSAVVCLGAHLVIDSGGIGYAGGAESSKGHLVVAGVGGLSALGMVIGALGPWARTPLLTFSGWAGIGLPLVLISFAALALQVMYAFVPRRVWLVLSALVALVSFLGACALALIIVTLGRFSGLVELFVARGTHHNAFSGQIVSVAWGIWLFAGMSVCLGFVSVAGLFGHFDASVNSGLGFRRGVRRLSAQTTDRSGVQTALESRPLPQPADKGNDWD